jgi:hypothetical protein
MLSAMLSPLDLVATRDQLREVLRTRCAPQELERVLDWAWPVVSGYRMLGQAVASQATIGFDPDMDGPVFTRT